MPATQHSRLPWLLAVGIVISGWLAGYFFWDPPTSFPSYFSGSDILLCLVLGLPIATIAGLLRRGQGWRATLGLVVLIAGATILAAQVSWAFYSICLDPGDVCVTSWNSRVLTLFAAIGTIMVGYVVEHLKTQ